MNNPKKKLKSMNVISKILLQIKFYDLQINDPKIAEIHDCSKIIKRKS